MQKRYIPIIFLFLFHFNGVAQIEGNGLNPWIFGLYVNAVNNSDQGISKPFNFKEDYNFSYPLKLSLEKRIYDDFGLEVSTSFNKIQEGKKFNGIFLEEAINLFSTELAFKYYISNLFLNPHRDYYEGYLLSGPGVTFFNSEGNLSINVGGGINFFITERFRIVLQGIAKIATISSNRGSNYFQFDLGGIIRI